MVHIDTTGQGSALTSDAIQRNRAWLQASNSRYRSDWREDFNSLIEPYLRPGATVLDVGSGRRPLISPSERPLDCTYIGLDISKEELDRAPEGSYDAQYIQDLAVHNAELKSRIDIALSWQVLEHIEPLAPALQNIHQYLRDGGVFVSLLTGRNAHFAMINRMVPSKLGIFAMRRLLGREPDTVFRAPYDHCTYSGLSELLTSWSSFQIVPIFRGAGYFRFFRPAAWAYLRYENWAARTNRKELATYYYVIARK